MTDRIIPPSGVYDVAIVSWHYKQTHYDCSFEIVRGRHLGFTFPERIDTLPKKQIERDIRDGFLALANDDDRNAIAAVQLARRCVHGVNTLGIKKWGWR